MIWCQSCKLVRAQSHFKPGKQFRSPFCFVDVRRRLSMETPSFLFFCISHAPVLLNAGYCCSYALIHNVPATFQILSIINSFLVIGSFIKNFCLHVYFRENQLLLITCSGIMQLSKFCYCKKNYRKTIQQQEFYFEIANC